jgi:hypothetical protein
MFNFLEVAEGMTDDTGTTRNLYMDKCKMKTKEKRERNAGTRTVVWLVCTSRPVHYRQHIHPAKSANESPRLHEVPLSTEFQKQQQQHAPQRAP